MNRSKLKGIMAEKDCNLTRLCELTGINVANLSRKIKGDVEFKREDIVKIRTALSLTDEQVMLIFFDENLH